MTPIEAIATLRDLLADAETDASRPTVCQIRAGQDALAVIEAHMRRVDSILRVLRRDPSAIQAAARAIASEGFDEGAVEDAVGKAGRS